MITYNIRFAVYSEGVFVEWKQDHLELDVPKEKKHNRQIVLQKFGQTIQYERGWQLAPFEATTVMNSRKRKKK